MPPKPAPLTRKLTPMWTEPPPLKDSIHLKHRSLSLEEIKELLAADSPPNDSSQDSLLKDKSHNSISTNESNEKLDHLIKSDTYPPKVNVLRPPQASAKQTLTSLAELPALPSLNKYIPDSTAYEDDFDEGLTDNDEEEFEYSDESILNE